jgi:hypothetical protein
MKRTASPWKIALIAIALSFSHSTGAQDTARPSETKKERKENRKPKVQELPTVLWRDPGDIASLDFTYGAGGQENQPQTQKFKLFDSNSRVSLPKK